MEGNRPLTRGHGKTERRRLPLHDQHVEFGARMIESEGWYLPLEFSGAFREYRAHRAACVVWDASNLASIRVRGPGAFDVVQRTFTNNPHRCGVGRGQYTFLLRETDAGILDDLMLWWVGPELFYLTASRPQLVLGALQAARDAEPQPSCAIEDLSADRVLLALQGAEATACAARLGVPTDSTPSFGVRELDLDGEPALVAATRFGRQPGFEMHLDREPGLKVYRLLVERGVVPAGLAMRETHRIEAGVPRYGFELGPDVSPVEAGYCRAVDFGTRFVGRAALEQRRERTAGELLRAVVMAGRGSPPPGSGLFLDGSKVGRVTSGNFSPRLHRGLGFAYVEREVAPGTEVSVRTAAWDATARLAEVPVDLGATW